MNTKTETLSAWLPSYHADSSHIAEQLPLTTLAFMSPAFTAKDWVKVGTAEITVTYDPPEAMREKAAEAIRAQMADAAAKYQAMQTELQDRLNKLLAIGYEEQA